MAFPLQRWQGTLESTGKSIRLEALYLLLEALTSQENSGEFLMSYSFHLCDYNHLPYVYDYMAGIEMSFASIVRKPK